MLSAIAAEHVFGNVVLPQRDHAHIVGHGAGLEHLQAHAAIEADGGDARLHGSEVRGAVQHARGSDQDVDIRFHHAFANRLGRIVVVRRTALEERDRHLGPELAENALDRLPDARVVRHVAEYEDALPCPDVAHERSAQVVHVAGHKRSARHGAAPRQWQGEGSLPRRSPEPTMSTLNRHAVWSSSIENQPVSVVLPV